MKHIRLICLLLIFLPGQITSLYGEVVLQSAEDAVNFALQNSETYIYQRLAGLENMKLAKYSFRDFLPSAGISFSESDSVSLNAADSRSKNLQFSLTQLLFDGGQRKTAYDMSKISSLYSFQEFEQRLRTFSSQIMNDYYSYLKQRELLKIKTDLVSAAQKQLLIAEKESALGLTLETDYLEYLINFMQIENERNQYERELKKLERKFKIAIGMDEHVDLIINDIWYGNISFIFLENNLDQLWALVKAGSIELRKQKASLLFSQKQASLAKKWYLPTISIEGGVSFSGNAYPLTEPKYNIKLMIGFEKNKVFPVNFSNGYGLDHNGLYSVNNSLNTQIVPGSTYLIEERIADITILQNGLQMADTEKALFETVYDLVTSHDDCLLDIGLTERTIELQKKRLEFRKRELTNGEIKSVDYLQDLIALSQQEIKLLELKTNAAALERSLEINAQIPFGELVNVCSKE